MAASEHDLTPDEIKDAVDETISLLKAQIVPFHRTGSPSRHDTPLEERVERIRRQVRALARGNTYDHR